MIDSAAIWKNLNSPNRLFLIAGPCVIENEKLCRTVAAKLVKTCRELGIFYVFKASFDKANRTSAKSFRGPGIEAGLKTLAAIRAEFGVPVLTDVHTEPQATAAGEVVDILQIPAFLCRQTDLIEAAVATDKIVNLKKGQFLSPAEMGRVAEKARLGGGKKILLTDQLIGFKPFPIPDLDVSKLPKVVTTVDLLSVFEAIEEASTVSARTEDADTLKRVFQSILMGGEDVGFDLSTEKSWLRRLSGVVSKASA